MKLARKRAHASKRWCPICRKCRALDGDVWADHVMPDTTVRCPMSYKIPREAVSPTTPRHAYSLLFPRLRRS